MPILTRYAAIAVQATILILAAAPWYGASAAPPQAPDAATCLAHPTVTCSVDLALAVSVDVKGYAYDRYQLVDFALAPVKDIAVRKAFLDRTSARFFAEGSDARRMVDDKRRVADIAAAIVAGDSDTADRLLGETKSNFQYWWKTLTEVLGTLAEGGKPGLAVATEAKYRRTVNVNLTDAVGRDLGKEVWSTQQLLARALVDCACGPDPLPTVLALPRQDDRRELAARLYARRHDLKGMTSFLTREFGKLAAVKDENKRKWIGYAFGLMLQEMPMREVPAAVRAAPPWLTSKYFESPYVHSMSVGVNIYARVLGRAIDTGNRPAVAAIVKLWGDRETEWVSEAGMKNLDAAEKVANLLPRTSRKRLSSLVVQNMISDGDARKGVKAYLEGPRGRAIRKRHVDDDDAVEFEGVVIEPLLQRGDFDLAEQAIKGLRERETREAMQEEIDDAKKKHAAAATYAAVLAVRWKAYQQSKKDSDAVQSFLYAVRDLIRDHPDAFPFT